LKNPQVSQFESVAFRHCSATLGRFRHPSPPIALSIASIFIHLRRAMGMPMYVLALVMSFSADLLGVLAAKIAGDE
jgi:hypothetical protein